MVNSKNFFNIQKLFCCRINNEFVEQNDIAYSSQWASLTTDFVKTLIIQKNTLQKIYRFSLVPDEIYKSTLLKKYFEDTDYVNNNFRFNEFERNSPKIIDSKDQTLKLINSFVFVC